MLDDISKQAREQMDKTLQILKKDLASLRAGRAHHKLIDRITVDYYGVPTPINQVANLSVPEPRLLVISPWETNMIPEIEKAIMKSDLGINPTNDGKVIRLVFPELTEERRKELVKLANKMGEDAKIAIRMARRNANDQIKKLKKNSEITEDEQKMGENEIQKITDEYVKKVDNMIKEKEKEIMEI